MSPWFQAGHVLLPLGYLLLLGAYLWVLAADRPASRHAAHVTLAVTVALHLTVFILQAVTERRLPLGSPLEFASLLALALVSVQGILERSQGTVTTGFVTAGLAFLLQLLDSLFASPVPRDHVLLRDPGFAGHVILVLLAYTALSVGFLHAVLYRVQARQLRRHRFGLLFRRLPSLERLERLSVAAVRLGVPLLVAALVWGQLWMYDLARRLPPALARRLSPFDPKILASWVIALVYAVGLAGHRWWGWRGRRMNLMAIAFYLAIVVTMGLIHHFLPSFHEFGGHGGF